MIPTINCSQSLKPIEPDAFTLALMLSSSELSNYSNFPALNKLVDIFLEGYQSFIETKFTPQNSYLALRYLYCLTNGYFNDFISDCINQFNPPYQLNCTNGILGELEKFKISNIVEQITQHGFYIFNQKLSLDICEKLKLFALTTPSKPYPSSEGNEKTIYNSKKLLAQTYHFDESDLLNNSEIQNLLVDSSILAIAQAYLGCKPIQDIVAMWWSTAFDKEPVSEAAQLYHFDMDRIKFIKFFIYLTEVTTHNGPHCHVRGSHESKPLELLKDGHIPDSEIEQYYGKEDIVEIIGSTGTIFAADTRGFHKGKHLHSSERLIFEIEFTNSLFGADYSNFSITPVGNKFIEKLSEYRYTFCRFA